MFSLNFRKVSLLFALTKGKLVQLRRNYSQDHTHLAAHSKILESLVLQVLKYVHIATKKKKRYPAQLLAPINRVLFFKMIRLDQTLVHESGPI